MTKSDFRATQSLAADLIRIEASLIRNQRQLLTSFDIIKNKVSELNGKITNVIEFRDSVNNITSSIRDTLDNIETDMTGLDGLDLFEFKNSPDEVILILRKCSESLGTLDAKIEDNLKLITKDKGTGLLQDELNLCNKDVHELLQSNQKHIDGIDSSIVSLMDEINHFKSHSKDLLNQRIL